MTMLKEAPHPHFETPVPKDILELGGTLIRFPVIPDSGAIALSGFAMNRGTVRLYYPPTDEGHSTRYTIDTFYETPVLPTHTKVDGRSIDPGRPYPLICNEKEVATVTRDGIMGVYIKDRSLPLDIRIGQKDTFVADITTPWFSCRISVKDFSGWMSSKGPRPHTTIHVVGTPEYHSINPVMRSWSMEFERGTMCTFHFLT